MAYKYGKKFKKNGKWVRYRYTNGKASTKKLVPAGSSNKKKPSFRGRAKPSTSRRTTRRSIRKRWN